MFPGKEKQNTDRSTISERVRSGIYGVCTGDALGVPAEMSQGTVHITDMIGGGAHGQPPGTWSDDSSLTLCLAASIAQTGGIHSNDIMGRFVEWNVNGAYTPWGECFDWGRSTKRAILRFQAGTTAVLCGDNKPNTNGNGSLMRILPMVYALPCDGTKPLSGSAMTAIHKVSALTHRHPLALSACGIYTSIAAKLLHGVCAEEAVAAGVRQSLDWYARHSRFHSILHQWERIWDVSAFRALPREQIRASGYVLDTLEAALWCLLTTQSYRECVLKAVNLGGDPDTTGAVAGGLAGLAYGYNAIPAEWIDALAGKDIIEGCCDGLTEYMEKREK